MSFLHILDQSPLFHRMMRLLRAREVSRIALKHFPRARRLEPSGIKYRCRFLETFVAADEIFHRNLYTKAIDANHLQTFADLGCNVGLFAALLAHATRRSDIQGILIDANPEMVEETRWLLKTNGLRCATAVYGLVGPSTGETTSEFFVSSSNLGSSQFRMDEPGKAKKHEWTKTEVPCLDLETVWLKEVGDVRCHVLKVDIEGSEVVLFRDENPFFKRVDTIVLEWHKWVIDSKTIHQLLRDRGFELAEVLEENETVGVAWYRSVPARS